MRVEFRGFPSWQQALREYVLGRYEVDGWAVGQLAALLMVSRERVRQMLTAAYTARDGSAPVVDMRRRWVRVR